MTEQEALDSIRNLKEEKERLEAENRSLTSQIRLLNRREDELKESAKLRYAVGLIDALVFAVRCNGVSGNEVDLQVRLRGCGND